MSPDKQSILGGASIGTAFAIIVGYAVLAIIAGAFNPFAWHFILRIVFAVWIALWVYWCFDWIGDEFDKINNR